jgi:hypothetical protein
MSEAQRVSAAQKYREWQHALADWEPEKTAGIDLGKAKALAYVLATNGTFGLDCYGSNVKLGRKIDLHRNNVGKYRHFLADMGVFTGLGRWVNNSEAVSIGTPPFRAAAAALHLADDPAVPGCNAAGVPLGEAATAASHNTSGAPPSGPEPVKACERCQYEGTVTHLSYLTRDWSGIDGYGIPVTWKLCNRCYAWVTEQVARRQLATSATAFLSPDGSPSPLPASPSGNRPSQPASPRAHGYNRGGSKGTCQQCASWRDLVDGVCARCRWQIDGDDSGECCGSCGRPGTFTGDECPACLSA